MKLTIVSLLLGVAILSPGEGFSFPYFSLGMEPAEKEKRHQRRLEELANSDAGERVYQLAKTTGALRFPNLEYLLQYEFSNLEDVAITSIRQGWRFHDLMSSEYDEYYFGFSAQVDGIEESFSCRGTLFFGNDSRNGHLHRWTDDHGNVQEEFYPNDRIYFDACYSGNVTLARFSIWLPHLGVKERSSRDGKKVLKNY